MACRYLTLTEAANLEKHKMVLQYTNIFYFFVITSALIIITVLIAKTAIQKRKVNIGTRNLLFYPRARIHQLRLNLSAISDQTSLK